MWKKSTLKTLTWSWGFSIRIVSFSFAILVGCNIQIFAKPNLPIFDIGVQIFSWKDIVVKRLIIACKDMMLFGIFGA